MKFYIVCTVLVAAVIIVECSHTFMGTNILKQRVYHNNIRYNPKYLKNREKNITISIPTSYGYQRPIQGILAFDLTNSSASANVTAGGIGSPFVTLRFKSERGRAINYDVNVYV